MRRARGPVLMLRAAKYLYTVSFFREDYFVQEMTFHHIFRMANDWNAQPDAGL